MASSPMQVGLDIASALNNASRAMKRATRDGLREAGKIARDELTKSGRRRTPSMRLRNMRGARLGVRTRVHEDSVSVSPTGPWGILEPGAKPHMIGQAGRPLRIGNQWVRGPVKHPGTRNTRAWTSGQEATFREVERDFPKMVGDDVEAAFNG